MPRSKEPPDKTEDAVQPTADERPPDRGANSVRQPERGSPKRPRQDGQRPKEQAETRYESIAVEIIFLAVLLADPDTAQARGNMDSYSSWDAASIHLPKAASDVPQTKPTSPPYIGRGNKARPCTPLQGVEEYRIVDNAWPDDGQTWNRSKGSDNNLALCSSWRDKYFTAMEKSPQAL